jgi:hypothetical protein
MADTVYQNAVSPEALSVAVTSTDYNLSAVSGATLRVRLPDASVETWSATVTGAAVSSLTLTHIFVNGDTSQLGIYAVSGTLAVPGGTLRTLETNFLVIAL